jgi:hypothetical protein
MHCFLADDESRTTSLYDVDKKQKNPDEGIVNPYPLVIVPKYGSPTPLKNKIRGRYLCSIPYHGYFLLLSMFAEF